MFRNIVAIPTPDNFVIAYMPKNYLKGKWDEILDDEDYAYKCKNFSDSDDITDCWIAYLPVDCISKKIDLKLDEISVVIEKPFNEDCGSGFELTDSKDERCINVSVDGDVVNITCKDEFGNSSHVSVDKQELISNINTAGIYTFHDMENEDYQE